MSQISRPVPTTFYQVRPLFVWVSDLNDECLLGRQGFLIRTLYGGMDQWGLRTGSDSIKKISFTVVVHSYEIRF